MAPTDLTTASIVAHNDNILHADIDQEVVPLSVTSGTCYGLNTVGSRIWHLMATPCAWAACATPCRRNSTSITTLASVRSSTSSRRRWPSA